LRIAFSSQVRIFWGSLIFVFLVCVGGCQKTTPPGADIVGGQIQNTSYTFLHWKEGLRVMIWYDITEDVGSGGSGSTSDPIYRLEGHASAPDGRRVDLRLETADGRTATYSINGQRYDLSRGALFLVTTRGERTQVRQLNRDLSTIHPTNESCEAFSETDPDVSAFIRSAGESP
jgi:hypothetical protein